MSGQGHNSQVHGQLKALIERIERLNEEEAAIKADKKEIYAEAKAFGLDPKIIRIVIQRRAQDPDQRQETEALVDIYENALRQPVADVRSGPVRVARPDSSPTPAGATAETPAPCKPGRTGQADAPPGEAGEAALINPDPAAVEAVSPRPANTADGAGEDDTPSPATVSAGVASLPDPADAAHTAERAEAAPGGAASAQPMPDAGEIPAFLRRVK